MTTPNENGQGDSALHICINCGEEVRHDGFAEGRAMFIDATCTRTCETLGGGEDTPAHFVNPEQMPQDCISEYRERLNSAAPDLYSALCGLLMHFEGPNCLAMQADVPAGFYLAEVEKARDAIAKAMGRQSPAQILQADYAQAEDSFPDFWENE